MGIFYRALGEDSVNLGVALREFHGGSNASMGTPTVSRLVHAIPRFGNCILASRNVEEVSATNRMGRGV